jgi:hypothetical protein
VASGRSLAVAAVGVAAAAGLWIAAAPGDATPTLPPAVSEAAAELDGRLREAGAALSSRAVTLSQLPRFAAAVQTDAATAEDLTRDELSFQLQAGETFELVQRQGDRVVSLLRMPKASAPRATVGEPGRRIVIENGALTVMEVVDIVPEGSSLRGAVVLTHIVGLVDIAQRLAEVGAMARIDVDGASLPLQGGGPAPGAAGTTSIRLAAPPGTAQLIAAAPTADAGRSVGLSVAAIAVGLLGLIGAVALRNPRPSPAPVAATPAPSALAAAGTPAPHPATAPTEYAGTPPVARGTSQGILPVTAPGDRLGRYALVRLLGSGGMADVYLARSTGEAGFEKPVALKVLHASLARRQDAVAYFLDEARLASGLIHPNIVQIQDLGIAGEAYYIAMELVDGADLDRLLRASREAGYRVPVAVALTVLRKMCDGLHAAHTAVASDGQPLALVHRDVKSANVLLSRDGIVKIGDFGIVKANQQLHVTAVGQASGTPAVMAPEQRMGGPIDRRADVYGVGAVAYEILTGREVNLDLIALMPRGVEGWPHLPAPSQVCPDLPPELDGIVLRALSFDPDSRQNSCADLEHELEHVATRHGLWASDKDVARWLSAILATLPAPTPSADGQRSNAVA